MASYLCFVSGTSGTMVTVDEGAPGEYAGRTLTCEVDEDAMGEPIYGQVTFPAGEPDPPPDPPEPVDPWGQRVANFLGQGDDPGLAALAGEHAAVITAMVRAYTRDNGFDGTGAPNDDLAAVITTATARLVANPEQNRHTVGGVQQLDGFKGWSLAETFVLNRYRKRAR